MRLITLLLLFTSIGLSAQDKWVGNYQTAYGNSYEIISIGKKNGCYIMTWGSGKSNSPISKLEDKPVDCENKDKFIVTLWEYEKYEFDPLERNEQGQVVRFEVLGFGEETIFKRF